MPDCERMELATESKSSLTNIGFSVVSVGSFT